MNFPCGVASNQNVGNFSATIFKVSTKYMTLPPSILFLAKRSGFHAKIPEATPFSISPSISLNTSRPGSFAVFTLVKLFYHKQILLLGVFPKLRQLRLNTQNLAFLVLT